MVEKINIFNSELRLMGFNLYIPLIMYGLYIFYFSKTDISFLVLQLMIVPLSSWWIIWMLEHNVEPLKYKLISTIIINPQSFFIQKYFFGLVSYCSLLIITLILTWDKKEWIPMLTLLLPQLLFFTTLAFLLVIVTKQASASITFIYIYVILSIFPIIELPFWPNILFLDQQNFDLSELINDCIVATVYSILFFYSGNKYFEIRENQEQIKKEYR